MTVGGTIISLRGNVGIAKPAQPVYRREEQHAKKLSARQSDFLGVKNRICAINGSELQIKLVSKCVFDLLILTQFCETILIFFIQKT